MLPSIFFSFTKKPMNTVNSVSGSMIKGLTIRHALIYYPETIETKNLVSAFIAFEKRAQKQSSELKSLAFNCSLNNLRHVRLCLILGVDANTVYEKKTILQQLAASYYSNGIKSWRTENKMEFEKTVLCCLRHGADPLKNVPTNATPSKQHYFKWLFERCAKKNCNIASTGISHLHFKAKDPSNSFCVHDKILKAKFRVIKWPVLLILLNAYRQHNLFTMLPPELMIEILVFSTVKRESASRLLEIVAKLEPPILTKKRKIEQLND